MYDYFHNCFGYGNPLVAILYWFASYCENRVNNITGSMCDWRYMVGSGSNNQ